MNKKVYIVSAKRTPIGSFLGSLASLSAADLASFVVRNIMNTLELPNDSIDEFFVGNVLAANTGQAPARQVVIKSGLATTTEATTINKVCASGTKAIMLAAQSIELGINDLVFAGGMESMSNVPHYIQNSRDGVKLGNSILVDGIIKDGLWDVYNNVHMGMAAENTAKEMGITREQQDEFAINSYKKANEAWSKQVFKEEITPIEVISRNGNIIVDTDEEYSKVNFDKIPQLKSVFMKDGTVTAANASSLNDGAAMLLLASEEALKKYNLTPIAEVLGYADAAQDPMWFTTAPSLAIPKAIKNAGLKTNDIDYYEINEAFAVVSLANQQMLNLDPSKVDVYGGAVSLGHPIGCSGARIVSTLLSVLKNNNASMGVSGICNGGGGASSIVIKSL